MLVGRFLMIIPMLAIAGNLAAKKYVPPSLGTFSCDHAAVHRAADRRDHHRWGTHILSGTGLGPILEHLLMKCGQDLLKESPWRRRRKERFGSGTSCDARSGMRWSRLNPRTMMGNPVMFVVEIGSVITTLLLLRAPKAQFSLQSPDHVVAVVHGAVRKFC